MSVIEYVTRTILLHIKMSWTFYIAINHERLKGGTSTLSIMSAGPPASPETGLLLCGLQSQNYKLFLFYANFS